ncbi:hypothetical protein [Novosphingobium album (ex Liu et al. 2023)]|uniref:Uncharacterized protein n=1 Tax=Novosphingobium album (ex Liu et al. 2023) TaxID=3031130 RepID=A0ABT5WT59_9SPHN|nr:hypothetical protein [Novosphingobium album (ex Liu et al. 2023)]MDE8652572.1 hypothetical protein [Novosphingobium album (ex Liu et al. 2023)]
MAGRFFLTLLALLTGLAAQIGPAQARTCVPADSAQIGVVAAVAAVRVAAAPAALARLPEAGWRHARRVSAGAITPAAIRPAPAVLIGIDRARE